MAARTGRDWAAVLLTAGIFFGTTASRHIQWTDHGHFVLRIVTGELVSHLGLALSHPLHFWLGQLAVAVLPVEPPFAVALVSAAAGAVTVANIFGLVRETTGLTGAAVVSSASLAVANTFWRMSAMPECYTVTTALLSAELWCMARYLGRRSGKSDLAPWLIAMMFFNGMGLANHNLALLTLPICGAVLIGARRRGHVDDHGFVLGIAAWVLGATPYLLLVMIEGSRTGGIMAAVHSAIFGSVYAESVLNFQPPLKFSGISMLFTLLSFPNLALPLACVGLMKTSAIVRSKAIRRVWTAALVIHLLFVLRYDVVDQYTFLLPAYTVLALFIGAGYSWVFGRVSDRAGRLLFVICMVGIGVAPWVYALTANVARDLVVLGDLARNKPYRDDYHYLFKPWGIDKTSAKEMSDFAIELAGQRGVLVVEDGMAMFPVKYRAWQLGRDEIVFQPELPADPSPDYA